MLIVQVKVFDMFFHIPGPEKLLTFWEQENPTDLGWKRPPDLKPVTIQRLVLWTHEYHRFPVRVLF